MKYSIIIIIISFTFFFAGCKKNDSTANTEHDDFSFMYNGQKYIYKITNNVANAGISKGMDGTPDLLIDMIDVFGGQIYYEKTGSAYLDTNSGGTIDSAKVFIYQSGSLNVSFSNCVTKTRTDLFTGQTAQYHDCAALGTFDLTLVNKNNETIKLTNGIVRFYHVEFQ